MIARLCAAQLARQIVRALHVPAPEQPVQQVGQAPAKRKTTKAKKKRKAA
jgi:hypothetical protein